ncbi:MAG: hypothetical protein CVU52_06105 [Deltaproteobacteria bacterium HGW-Deltaproteobacteria-10]|nr:MAG: hypothetical protein CVU52_06105 [Deltaproteobacteria bacterium HGW-Deltaproteobacteria-10]
MSYYRIFTRIFILLPVLFLSLGGKAALAAESGFPAGPKEKMEQKVQRTGIVQQEKLPAFQYSADMPDRSAIGCVLPLSGRYGDYGSKALDAILLAAGMFDEKNKTRWKIIAEDSRGIPQRARDAVARLAKKDNVMAIIVVAGTLEAVEVAQEAGKWKMPVILITPKEGVTSANDYVFQHFLTSSQQINALVKYALDDLNCAIFSILYPKDDYGVEMANNFRAQANSLGGKIESAIGYGKTQTDFTEEIKRATRNTVSAPKKAGAHNQAAVSVDFEAIFIPDSYSRVKMIVSQLAFHDVKGIPLLGTSLWNSPDLLRKDAEYLEGSVFTDSFFVNGFYPETNDFVDIFYTAYSREPENIEALSYDTMGMIISVLKDKYILTREQFIAGLQQIKNYQGATGSTSFLPGRVSRKAAFILKIKGGKLVQVK